MALGAEYGIKSHDIKNHKHHERIICIFGRWI